MTTGETDYELIDTVKSKTEASSETTASSSASSRINARQINEPVDHTTTSTNDQTNPTQNNDIPIPTPASSKKTRVSPTILRDKHEYSEVIPILTFQGIQFGYMQTKPEGVAFFPPRLMIFE
ncbi:hypothetical protein GWI33_021398 [Rhynchophorus ferrugineus]|uniref:Uncharacterized protein n=1 Tax=Rhynchophorus ferrugineus TaxID=354439 RepID=A0A834HPZ3_RHYFE|nr:hypothetical protein GWI33_021398 [Rhynchophorus ferrugineus]